MAEGHLDPQALKFDFRHLTLVLLLHGFPELVCAILLFSSSSSHFSCFSPF